MKTDDKFEENLQIELNKLPYTKHLDDGGFNDGVGSGFERGARWCRGQNEEYAEQKAIEFTKFLENSDGFRLRSPNKWLNLFTGKEITTTELYAEFLNQNNK